MNATQGKGDFKNGAQASGIRNWIDCDGIY